MAWKFLPSSPPRLLIYPVWKRHTEHRIASSGVMKPELLMKLIIPLVMAGTVGDADVRENAQQSKLFVGMILILNFAEALALYELIVAIILSLRVGQSKATFMQSG